MTYSAFSTLLMLRHASTRLDLPRLRLDDRRFDALAARSGDIPAGGEGAAAHHLDGAGFLGFRPCAGQRSQELIERHGQEQKGEETNKKRQD